ncbi:MAG: class I SAM-dependent methyltransferase [Paludibacteraceae bacterium]|nr:class I SAM-dependent methyltransferase [Paludibacteraceae bacterium]
MVLPEWLDKLIFEELGAKYSPSYSDMTNIHDDREKTLNYLGTYFPRSYAESYYIFTSYFQKYRLEWEKRESLSIFDFGSGTGGEIIGLLTVLNETFPLLKKVRVVALDGNQIALRLFEKVIREQRDYLDFELDVKISPIHVEDFYDIETLNVVLNEQFDLVMTFKAICEFVTEQEFLERNPYQHLLSFFSGKLNEGGIVLLEDITTYNKCKNEWLPVMMDNGISQVKCEVVHKNQGYNKELHISHSRKVSDYSKIAWRVLKL